MRPLVSALAALVLFAAPVVLSAQPFNQQPLPPPHGHPVPPVNPHPYVMPTRGMHRPNGNRNATTYPILIDGSVVNRYLATPTPAPHHTQAPRHTNNGQDVFETHSSDDAK